LTAASLDGTDFADVFQDVETIDFTGADITSGTVAFALGDVQDITGQTGASAGLTINIDNTDITFGELSFTGATLDSKDGTTQEYSWAGGERVTVIDTI